MLIKEHSEHITHHPESAVHIGNPLIPVSRVGVLDEIHNVVDELRARVIKPGPDHPAGRTKEQLPPQ